MSPRTLLLVRVGLATLGIALTATGAYFLLTTEPPAAIAGLVVWLAAAVILHDGVFAPTVNVADRMLARASTRLPAASATTVRILFGVGVVLTLVVVPELIAQARPHANPTILLGDYALRLAAVWAAIVVAAAVVIAVPAWRIHRRTGRRRSIRA